MLDYNPNISREVLKDRKHNLSVSFSKEKKEVSLYKINELMPTSYIEGVKFLSKNLIRLDDLSHSFFNDLLSGEILDKREDEIIDSLDEIKDTIKDNLYDGASDEEISNIDKEVVDNINDYKFDTSSTVYLFKITSIVNAHLCNSEATINAISALKLEIGKLNGAMQIEEELGRSIMSYKGRDIKRAIKLASDTSSVNTVNVSLINCLKHLGSLKRLRDANMRDMLLLTSDVTDKLDNAIERLVRSLVYEREVNSFYLREMNSYFKLAKSFFSNNKKEDQI